MTTRVDTKVVGDTAVMGALVDYLEDFDGYHSLVEWEVEVQLASVGGTPAISYIVAVVRATFGPIPVGITAVRKIAGTSTWSQHAYSNAADFMVGEPNPLHRAVAMFLDANRGPLSVAHLLADPYFPSPLGDHYNHVHVDPYPQWCGTPPGHPCT